jgi:hypothetical protein
MTCSCFAEDPPQFSLSIVLPEKEVKVGSYVRVNVITTNVSVRDMPVVVPVRTVECDYDVFVRDEKGNAAPLTEYGKKIYSRTRDCQSGFNSVVSGTLKPGATVQEHFFVNSVYDLARPGTYTVQIAARRRSVQIKSNTLTFIVSE